MTRQGSSAVRAIAVGVVVIAVAGAAAAAFGLDGRGADSGKPRPPAAKTTTVTRRTLVDASTAAGRIAYRDPAPVISSATGVVTWLPAVGTVVLRGDPLLRVNDQPVVLLIGALPMYRQLTTGTKGEDVKQLKQNLKQLGYAGFTVSTEYDAATATAVKRWQQKLQREPTGNVEIADVIYSAGPLRVARQSVRVGASAPGEVLTATGTTKMVIAAVAKPDVRLARAGNAVTLQVPGGRELPGKVVAVGADADRIVALDHAGGGGGTADKDSGSTLTALGGDQDSTLVAVSLVDGAVLDLPDDASVTIRYVAASRADVLTVPVQALLALTGGGYGLEIRDAAGIRVVPVRTGLFADGQVEVSGEGIAEGTTVGMAG
ncbi:peptidoglycan-binding protein [Dactylosporangium sp. CA-092794]|uniref:peptidoglycan-binding protein n=1 Tax=Dactylosporangium sp. CA-092794 TaxID=3239929 RepID=UPI003D90FA42